MYVHEYEFDEWFDTFDTEVKYWLHTHTIKADNGLPYELLPNKEDNYYNWAYNEWDKNYKHPIDSALVYVQMFDNSVQELYKKPTFEF